MSIKDRLAAKSASIGTSPRLQKPNDDQTARPKTAPGQLMASLPLLAEKERELQAAMKRIEELEATGIRSSEEIDIASLVEVPDRRRVLSDEEYEELRTNLASNPLIHPIVYRPLSDGRKEIISGNNRVAIYRDLNRSYIRAVPFEGTDAEVELGAAFSNLLAPSLPDFEKYRQFERIKNNLGLSQADIIRMSGLAQSHVARVLSFESLPDAAKEIIARKPHRLGGTAAAKFAALAQQGRAEEVTKAIAALIQSTDMTQERALALALPTRVKAAQPTATAINLGKRKFCEVTVRSGVVGLRFAGKDAEAAAEEWGERIARFIRSELDDQ
ncbi:MULTISPECIES: ParB/RepB/Spo0J family partition protein [Paraburkholderia]|uniref:Chromosome partitioning protein ParB n=1 Tax=Paraburkholderia dipogonis TaxID=1211383 RepID=A0A4Y8MHT7_9BURK|nr:MULTISPECIES: ParB/RepB/Spo0J family partition protein [Paraburkholderia]RKR31145.1 ParB family chromosome partitioning protein [Paraburkholderia sp. BL17N1]TFE36988.1 chromosome partitioning protein ParB [Paraburkholderia dipogonis]